MDKVGLGLLIVSLSGLAGGARAADAVPFFKADPKPVMYGGAPLFVPDPKPVMYGPVLPDPSAPECGIDDQPCLDRHDARVLSLASSSHARQECAESTHPELCYEAYDMMAGDFVPKPDAILSDPCAWVVLVDHNVATVSSKKLGITKRILNHGWKARTFVGACNVSSVVPMQPASIIPMPAWTVRKGQPLPATPASAPPRAVVVPVAVNAAPRSTTPATAVPTAATPRSAMPAAPVALAPPAPLPARPVPSVQAPPAPAVPAAPAAAPAPPPPSTAPTPPAPVAGPPGTTTPPPFARPATISDAQGPPSPSR